MPEGFMKTIDFSREPNAEQITLATDWFARGGYRVIRPLQVRTTYSDAPPPEKLITVAILVTETTLPLWGGLQYRIGRHAGTRPVVGSNYRVGDRFPASCGTPGKHRCRSRRHACCHRR